MARSGAAGGAGLRVYIEVARRSFRRQSTYRAATAAGAFTNSVFGVILASVLAAVFAERGVVGGFDRTDAVTFTFVSQGLLTVVQLMGLDDEVSARIRTGDIVSDLQRPIDFQGYWWAVSTGRSAFHAIARGVPPVLVGALVFRLRLPGGALTWAAFAVSVLLGATAAFSFRLLLQLSAFWILDSRGPTQIGSLLASFLAGVALPLVLLPGGVYEVVRLLPWASMVQTPIEVFLEKRVGAGLVGALAVQVLWVGALWTVTDAVLARALRKVVVQGG